MGRTELMLSIPMVLMLSGAVAAQPIDEASCSACSATYVGAEEILEYLKVGGLDQQVRSVDVGRSNVQIALVHRGRLEQPAGVAEHDLVTEVYYVIAGSGTSLTGPDLVDATPRLSTNTAVQRLNGPGHNAAAIRNGVTHELTPGDVLVIPAGTGHQFTRIDNYITYLMVRVDPDKVVPLMDEADSREYLEENLP
jgi:mannose-6-phosphate isomerase-like protein (cupin superfamily)